MVFFWDDMLLSLVEGGTKAMGAAAGQATMASGRAAKSRKQFNKDLMWEKGERMRQIKEGARDVIAQANFQTLAGGIREGTHEYAINKYASGLQGKVAKDVDARVQKKPKGMGRIFEGIFNFFGG